MVLYYCSYAFCINIVKGFSKNISLNFININFIGNVLLIDNREVFILKFFKLYMSVPNIIWNLVYSVQASYTKIH